MFEFITTALLLSAILFALLVVQAPGILAVMAVGIAAVLLSVAERISGAPRGSYVRALRALRERPAPNQGGEPGGEQ